MVENLMSVPVETFPFTEQNITDMGENKIDDYSILGKWSSVSELFSRLEMWKPKWFLI